MKLIHKASSFFCIPQAMKLASFPSLICLLALILQAMRLSIAIATLSPIFNTTTADKLALLSFRSLLADPHKALISWSNDSLSICQWQGVTCGRRHPHRVTALDLDSLDLNGPVSPLLSNLTFLQRIHLPNNKLYGSIPQDLGRLSRLRYLNLSYNSLDGEIPASMSHCSHLQVISLSKNRLQGEIPSNLTQCSILRLLGLAYNSLSGEIPAEFGSFQYLETLNLKTNKLSGNIPSLLGSTSSLRYVDLPNNELTGGIPPLLANSSSLMYLDLSSNNLSGGIPAALGNSSSLQLLDISENSLTGVIPNFSSMTPSALVSLGLSTNQLTGKIPPSLGNLSSLLILRLSSNNLQGHIPDTIGSIPRLEALDFSQNNLSGPLPSSLYNISSLTYFGVGHNDLSGTLPSDMGLALPNLETLEMSRNLFHGIIPISLCNASRLQFLYLSENNFSGPVPSNMGSLRDLQWLFLESNQLEADDWSFFTSLTNCSHLQYLYLHNNLLEGTLPLLVGNLSTNLEWLRMGNNKIHGTVPNEIGNLGSLTVLILDQNLLYGKIPASIGQLQNLHVLDLSGNKFSGTIPSSLGNCTQLNNLYMDENNLSGLIPSSLGLCGNLESVNLSGNSLSGNIPKEIVSLSSLTLFLDLSHNYLTGSVPIEVGRLVNLVQLNFSNNQLTGDIPPALSSCLLLQYLYLENNLFQGGIPQSIAALHGMMELDLSCNNLSGQIPNFLDTFRSLQRLNLSFNDFSGEVPKAGIFRNASQFSILGNKRLCGGDPILQLPTCPFQSSSGGRSSHRLLVTIIIISVASAVMLSLLFIFGILYRLRRSREKDLSDTPSQDSNYNRVSYAEIVKATGNFSSANIVGCGSFGNVYRGKIASIESDIAVKVLHVGWGGAQKSFGAECEVLRNIRHRNIVRIITSCSSVDYKGNDFKALVYEYMPNGTLAKWLHPQGHNPPWFQKLDLMQRLDIAADVASALEYLHHRCVPPVIHCDLKPSNILLDSDMTALVSDFGLARFLVTTAANSTSLMGMKGSIGYVAPEYGMGNHISTKGDVYSYGVLLLEMLSGKRPTDEIFKDGLSLHTFVNNAFPDRITEILDPQILQEGAEDADDIRTEVCIGEKMLTCIVCLIRVALSCSNESPSARMEMRDVAKVIHTNRDVFKEGWNL